MAPRVFPYFLLFLTTTGAQQSAGVPEVYYVWYSGTNYISWCQSSEFCRARGGYLPVTNTTQSYNDIMDFVSAVGMLSEFWVGLYSPTPWGSVYKWERNGEQQSSSLDYWHRNEPNNKDYELCVRMNTRGKWRTTDCEVKNMYIYVVCEFYKGSNVAWSANGLDSTSPEPAHNLNYTCSIHFARPLSQTTQEDATLAETSMSDARLPETTAYDATPAETTVSDAKLAETTLLDATTAETTVSDATTADITVPDATIANSTVYELTTADTTVSDIDTPFANSSVSGSAVTYIETTPTAFNSVPVSSQNRVVPTLCPCQKSLLPPPPPADLIVVPVNTTSRYRRLRCTEYTVPTAPQTAITVTMLGVTGFVIIFVICCDITRPWLRHVTPEKSTAKAADVFTKSEKKKGAGMTE